MANLSDLQEQLVTAQTALGAALSDLQTDAVPSLADNVLAAIVPVLEAAGWSKPVPSEPPASE